MRTSADYCGLTRTSVIVTLEKVSKDLKVEINWKQVTEDVGTIIVATSVDVGTLAAYIWVSQVVWNAIMPTIFALPELTYWQAMQLLVLYDVFVSFSCKLNNITSNQQ